MPEAVSRAFRLYPSPPFLYYSAPQLRHSGRRLALTAGNRAQTLEALRPTWVRSRERLERLLTAHAKHLPWQNSP